MIELLLDICKLSPVDFSVIKLQIDFVILSQIHFINDNFKHLIAQFMKIMY